MDIERLRRALIEAFENRGWKHPDANLAAESIASFYEVGDGEWIVRLSEAPDDPPFYQVARREDEVFVYVTLLEGRARDVANALNEIERSGPDATGTP